MELGHLLFFAFPVTGGGENRISSFYVTGLCWWEFRRFISPPCKNGREKWGGKTTNNT